jgi:trehalose/maltose hydrolase-like predicted phosphorylase
MVQSCPPHGFTLSIPAKGLSGKGYRGHVFWDTDIFMLPFFLHTDPRAARRLMDYRIHTLEGARRKARKAGHRGAMFAWESADTGDETCPPYVPDPRTGDPVRVLTGDMEQHISADVVYAAWHYIQATADVAFQEREFLKLCVLTARFWTSRVKRDRLSNLFEIPGVIGPDEYHVEVDNNAFTNYLAAWNLRIAAEQVTRLLRVHRRSRVLRDLRVQKTEVDRWFRIADRMYLPGPVYKGPWEQHQGFFNLRKTAPRRLAASRFSSEKRRAAILQKTQILKQADVVMLMTLFPDVFPVEAKRSNWNYYEPRTLHESSLSPGVHSMVASDLGLRKDAYAYFRKSALLDLNDTMGNTALGLHLGAMGGAWQAVAKGFLGLRLDANEPTFYPRLPDAWKGVALCIEHRGARFIVEATHEASRMRPCP